MLNQIHLASWKIPLLLPFFSWVIGANFIGKPVIAILILGWKLLVLALAFPLMFYFEKFHTKIKLEEYN